LKSWLEIQFKERFKSNINKDFEGVIVDEDYKKLCEYTFSLNFYKLVNKMMCDKMLKVIKVVLREDIKSIKSIFDWFKNQLR